MNISLISSLFSLLIFFFFLSNYSIVDLCFSRVSMFELNFLFLPEIIRDVDVFED